MLSSLRLTAAASFAAGAGISAALSRGLKERPVNDLCGTYELVSCAVQGPSSGETEKRGTEDGKSFGLLVYQPNGRVTAHMKVEKSDVWYAGRYAIHDALTFYPPHGNPTVEHIVETASVAELIGKTIPQQFSLCDGGRRLKQSDMAILAGSAKNTATYEWQRI